MTAYDFMVFAKKKTAMHLNDNYGGLFNRPIVWTDLEVKWQNASQGIILTVPQIPTYHFELTRDNKRRLYLLRIFHCAETKYFFDVDTLLAYAEGATHKSREAVKAYADDLFR